MRANWLYLIISVLMLTLLAAACGSSLTDSEKRRLDSLTYDIEQDPTEPRLYQNRGRFYLDRCMLENAVEDYTMAIQLSQDPNLDPTVIRIYSHGKRAEAYILLGNSAEANWDQKQALILSQTSRWGGGAENNLEIGFDAAKKRAEIDPC